MEPGANSFCQRHLVGIDHGVAQAANMGDHGERAVAHRAKLRQSARFEARRYKQRVAATLDQVGQAFVVADLHGDIGASRRTQCCFQRSIARTQQCELRAGAEQGWQRGEDEVNSLLHREPADHAEQQTPGIGAQAETLLQRRFVRDAIAR